MSSGDSDFREIIGQRLTAITFFGDFLQLHFEGRRVAIYTSAWVTAGGATSVGTEKFPAEALCSQISKGVAAVPHSLDQVRIEFTDGSGILISLQGPRSCPEALETAGFDRNFWM